MICLSLLFNKLAGFYGILALITGYDISLPQLSMYIYSIAALVALIYFMSHIRLQSPLQNLGLAYFYLFDTISNTIYTTIFASTWFKTLSATQSDGNANMPGGNMMGGTAGFTNPETPGVPDASAGTATTPSLAHGVEFSESAPSIIILIALTLVRVYFIIILFSFARTSLLSYIATQSSRRTHLHMDGAADEADGPFAVGGALGEGWKGKLGRAMTHVGRGWWLAVVKDDEEWARSAQRRFKNVSVQEELPGTVLREQRARSGTGPPPLRIETLTRVVKEGQGPMSAHI
jgi:hypothetical protein